jgi:Protein of unknown function (DUF3160)
MFDQNEPNNMDQDVSGNGFKTFLSDNKSLLIGGIVALIVIVAIVYFVVTYINKNKKTEVVPQINPVTEVTTSTFAVLPTENSTSTDSIISSTTLEKLEKYNFRDFYQEPAPIPDFNFKDYKLPLNIKIDALNYYDISRKISLDDSLDNLNNNGFSVLENPDPKNIKDFYSAYSWLSNKQVPLLVTSDFLLHYHQNVVKQVFKDVEENIFYENLWHISKILYESSKNRYEARLAKIGNVNDRVLEGERLATAYFAVALKLLEPDASQIDTTGKDDTKFSNNDSAIFSFTILPYLQSDAGGEISLIKEARNTKKSPVLLYNRNYTDFVVPAEYRSNAKLYNFYLTSTWLNSVFPLVVKDKVCQDCLLDKDDARLSLIASTFITKDFSADQELKNRWALVYKLISYSKGLRDDLTYLNYNDTMKGLFGETYDPEIIFAEDNIDSIKNLDKLKEALLDLNFNKSQGALDKTKDKPRIGFKLLSDYYFPNDYILNHLIGDEVGNYNGDKATGTNYTVCHEGLKRCNGFALDVIGIISDKLSASVYWLENTNFASYAEKLLAIKTEIKNASIWHNNNFWSTLGAVKNIFENNNGQMQAYASTNSWQLRLIDTAAATWVDLQLPLEQLVPAGAPVKTGLSTDISFNDNFYIEPNYFLIQKLLADNEMIYGMLDVMGVNKEVTSIAVNLKEENGKLRQLSDLIKKELNGEALNSDDQSFINVLVKQYQLTQVPSNMIYLKNGNASLTEENSFKLMSLVYQLNEGKYIVVGPVFSYKERRQ